MKHIHTILLSSFFLLFAHPLFSQCEADAGKDAHHCTAGEYFTLGGDPTASGGVEPYTFEWSIEPIETILTSHPFIYASDLLDDTTIANPTVQLWDSSTTDFFLKVTDANGCESYDTIRLSESIFYEHLGTLTYTIDLGDSVFMDMGPNISCGFSESCDYLWQPTHGLSDSTLATNFWAKPDYSISYYVIATDSVNCSKVGGHFVYINVNPLSIDKNKHAPISIFPNPTKDIVQIESKDNPIDNLEIYSINGRKIKEIANFKSHSVDLTAYQSGLYFLKIWSNQKSQTFKVIKE